MGLKHFLHKAGAGAVQSVKTIKNPIKDVIHSPQRLLTGAIDPIGTKISNTLTGQHQAPIVNQFGGPTKTTLNDVGANSYARGGFKVADLVAGYFGGAGAANGIGNAFATNGVNVGVGNSAGATALRNAGSIPTGPSTGELMAAGPNGGATAGDAALSPVTLGSNAVKIGGTAPASASTSGVGNLFNKYGQYIGPLISAGGQIAAGNAAAKGDAAALDEWRRQYDTSRNDLAPWRNTGTGALTRLNALYGIGPNGEAVAPDMSGFTTSPDYQFNLGENLKAVQNSAAARGGLYSGNTYKALQERGANVASGEFGNYVNRLLAAAGMGQTATNATVSAGNDSTSAIGQLLRGAGDTRASVISGVGNEFANAFDTAGGRYAAGRRYPNYYGGP